MVKAAESGFPVVTWLRMEGHAVVVVTNNYNLSMEPGFLRLRVGWLFQRLPTSCHPHMAFEDVLCPKRRLPVRNWWLLICQKTTHFIIPQSHFKTEPSERLQHQTSQEKPFCLKSGLGLSASIRWLTN